MYVSQSVFQAICDRGKEEEAGAVDGKARMLTTRLPPPPSPAVALPVPLLLHPQHVSREEDMQTQR